MWIRLRLLWLFCAALSVGAGSLLASDDPLFHSSDPLASRDDAGVFHQMANLNPTDWAPRYRSRLFYYNKSEDTLVSDPAYVGSLQVSLHRYGYYCGPIDGVFSGEVTDAIARMQKAYTMRVTGRLTVPVRRALNLP